MEVLPRPQGPELSGCWGTEGGRDIEITWRYRERMWKRGRETEARQSRETDREAETHRERRERETDRHVEIERKRGREKASFYCLCWASVSLPKRIDQLIGPSVAFSQQASNLSVILLYNKPPQNFKVQTTTVYYFSIILWSGWVVLAWGHSCNWTQRATSWAEVLKWSHPRVWGIMRFLEAWSPLLLLLGLEA